MRGVGELVGKEVTVLELMGCKKDGGFSLPQFFAGSHDFAAMLCAFFVVMRGWSVSRVALTFGAPLLLVEECLFSGVSSATLRSQLALWAVENKNISMPADVVRNVLEAAAAAASSVDVSEVIQCDDSFCAPDTVARTYFSKLGSSVGQSFVSILNDPHVSTEGSNNWGGWLGSFLTGSSDKKRHSTISTEINGNFGESSEVLLAQYGLWEGYSSYLQLVLAPYSMNREEERLALVAAGASNPFCVTGSSSTMAEHELPWPSLVPKEFFTTSYDASDEVRLLEQMLRERKGCVGSDGEATLDTLDTFVGEFDVMESRMKELREWEAAVEGCIFLHVQHKSERFFAISQEFGVRAVEAGETLGDLQRARRDIGKFGKGLVREMMTIAQLYRRRNSLGTVCALAELILDIFFRIQFLENWFALPERDMSEIYSAVENFCALQNILESGKCSEVSAVGSSPSLALEMGWVAGVTVLKDVPRRVRVVKDNLFVMIVEKLRTLLIPSSVDVDINDCGLAKIVLSAVMLGIWPTSVQQCRDLLVAELWVTVRETFIAFMMSHCTVSDSTANAILSTAVSVDSSRDEKLNLFSYSNVCSFALYMQLVNAVVDRILDFVSQATQRWGFVFLETAAEFSTSRNAGVSEEDTRNYFLALCVMVEGIVSLLVETRSQEGKAPKHVQDVEMLVLVCFSSLENMVSAFQAVLAICDKIGDALTFSSGKRLKSAVTRLAKEHFRVHHIDSIEKLRLVTETETWQSEQIGVAFQSCVDTICRSDDASVEELRARAVFSDVMNDEGFLQAVIKKTTASATAVGRTDSFDMSEAGLRMEQQLRLSSVTGHVEGRVVSGSLLLLVELLHEYDGYLGRFPFMAFDVMGRIYDLFKFYVSQSAALLLGAMAVEKGMLPTITAQHMAVASQNLTFLYNTIPLMQKRWLLVIPVSKLTLFVNEDMERVRKDCATYRCELFKKISNLVKEKVDGFGAVAAGEWKTSGNEWIMTMLRETARLIRVLRPLLCAEDCNIILVPLLGTFARMIRSVTLSPEVDANIRAVMLSDVLLFKANVERFGFDVLRCAELCALETGAVALPSLEPCTSEAVALAWFFGDEQQK